MANPSAFQVIGDALAPYAYIGGVGRFFGRIFADVTIEERHDDEMAITDHPVETGAAISDHCFVLPARLELRIGFSDSTGKSEGYSREQYAEILALRNEREPFDVSTGKRQYKNMLIAGIQVTTDADSETSLKAIIRLREVIRVSTQTASGPAPTDTAAQKNPQVTSSTQNVGTVQVNGTDSSVPTFAAQSQVPAFSNVPTYNNYISANGVGVFPGAGGSEVPTGGGSFPIAAHPWGT